VHHGPRQLFEKDLEGRASPAYNTDYVRENDFDAGRGALFLQRRGEVSKLEQDASNTWIPDAALSLTDAYRSGMRWAYRKLEQDYEAQARGDWSRLPFVVMHKRIIRGFKEILSPATVRQTSTRVSRKTPRGESK
jgi:hypothetical protein